MYNEEELLHYGVPGMRWGHRKAQYTSDVDKARANYKDAKKKYNKSFSAAYNRSSSAYSPIKKHRQANTERWERALSDAERLRDAKSQYKQAKKNAKEAAKSEKQNKMSDIDKYAKETAKNTAIRRAGYGAKITGSVLNSIGQNLYDTYKDNSTPGKTAVMNGLGRTGRALDAIGNVAITGSFIKQVRDFRKYY